MKKNFNYKRKFINKEKKLDKIHYIVILVLMLIGILNYIIFDPITIGHDFRYSIYIFWLPVIFGIIILSIYRKKFLITKFTISKGLALKSFLICFYLLQGLLFSYLSFGLIAKLIFNYINKDTANQYQTEMLKCEVTRFWSKRNASVDFKFQNRYESFKVSYDFIKDYIGENPENYIIEINANKGVRNYYIVNDWKLIATHRQ